MENREITRTLKIVYRVILAVFTVFLTVLSSFAGWKIGGLIALLMLCTNFMTSATFKRIFHSARWAVICVGTVIWIVVVLFEVK
jgi:hypothetical protein